MRNLSYLLIIIMLSGCISEYNHKGIEEVSDLLVMEGKITDDESVFSIRRSVGLSEKLLGRETVDDAIVYVEKDNGEKLQGVFNGGGTYSVSTGVLDPKVKYCLYVKINEEEYRSELLYPIFTSEIDSITVYKKERGEPVHVRINSRDTKDQSRYYLWSYKETWEMTATLFAEYGYLNGSNGFFTLANSENIYHCWGRDSSQALLLGTSDKLSENVISQKTIAEIVSNSDKLSVLYYIAVEQNQIRKEAFDYFSNIQRNVSQTGGIFAAVPSEMKGNIKCVTKPNLPVIGYIDVTTTTRNALYIPLNMSLYEPSINYCIDSIKYDDSDGYSIYTYMPRTYAPQECLDCRMKYRATKDRPDFWPNEHY